MPREHVIETTEPILEAEDGLILGNGDLSVSIYQRSEHLVWRFGKNDVWDRRIDFSDDYEPAHIDEIKRGLREEGWVSGTYRGGGKAKATKGDPADEKRMNEICEVCPSYAKRPYPCPKPVGELWMHLPIDKHEMTVHQRLVIERDECEITVSWPDGCEIRLLCFVHPTLNVLTVKWEVVNWNSATALSHQVPVWFSVFRWADSTIEEFRFELQNRGRNPYIPYPDDPADATPLDPPSYKEFEGHWVIEQAFHPDLEFKDGYKYLLQPFTTPDGLIVDPVRVSPSVGDKAIHLYGNDDVLKGWMCVAIPCSSDEGGCEAQAKRFVNDVAGKEAETFQRWRAENLVAADAFWAQSAIEMDDELLEDTWYENVYLRRCTYRADVIAPGLELPSTVQDYSMWHGDYHMDFNYQQPFYGDFGSNHLDIGDAYFPGIKHMVDIGRVTYETANEAALAANGGVLIAVPFDGAYEPDPSGYVAVGGGSIVNGPSLPHAVDGVVAGTEDFGADFAIDPMQPWLGEYSQGGMIRPIGEWVGAIRSPVGRTASGHIKPAAVYQ